MKVTLSKTMAGGEQIVVELRDPTDEDMTKAYRLADARLKVMNLRILAMNKLYPTLVKQHPKAALLMNDIIQVLVGEQMLKTSVVEQAQAAAAKELAEGGDPA